MTPVRAESMRRPDAHIEINDYPSENQALSSKIDTPLAPANAKPTKRRTLLRAILRCTVLAGIVVFAAAAGVLTYFYTCSQTVHDTVNAFVTRADTPEKAFPGRTELNVLLLGRDLDRDNHGRILRTHGRTDAILLAHVDFTSRTLNVLSIPRDTLVRIPGCRGKRKINTANAIGGPDLAQRTIADFLNVCPDHYVLVNFNAFEKAIDAVGGLEMIVDKQLDYDDNWGNLHIHLKPGLQVLDGNQAIGFVRYRHSNDGGGDSDFVRIGRQQQLLHAAKARLSSPRVMFRVPQILDMIRADTESSLTPSQMICLMSFAKSLRHTDIRMETLPALDTGRVFVKADPDATEQLVQDMFFEKGP